MIKPDFRRQNSYGRDLKRETEQLEKNVGLAFDKIVEQAWARLVPTDTKTSSYTAKLDELITTKDSFTIALPVATSSNQGRAVDVIVLSGTITVMSASSLVQGKISDEIEAVGLYLYISDGLGWYRIGGVSSITTGDGLIGGGTGDVTIEIDTITSDMVDDSIATTKDVDKLLKELQHIRLLLIDLVNLELV